MGLQYISDTQGRHTAVVIQIEDWNILTLKHQDLKVLENPQQNIARSKLSEKYRGIISKEQGQNLNEHIKQMRSEWVCHYYR